jgi:hypothetical protein
VTEQEVTTMATTHAPALDTAALAICAATAIVALDLQMTSVKAEAPKKATVEAEASLRVPAVDYRKDWVNLGVFSVLADTPTDGAKQIHVVYTARQNVDAYLATGRFPDGAMLVKDVFVPETETLTTGTASYPGTLAGRFVMVKDGAGRNAASPRFGDGWGWAFYEDTETMRTVTTDYKTDCLGCHEPARATDLLYVRGYPVLRK